MVIANVGRTIRRIRSRAPAPPPGPSPTSLLLLDVKPGNIIVRKGDPRRRAVLIDFGLCRRGLDASPGSKLRGSLPCMAPEYFQAGPIGPWTDVYALGVAIYRLATGTFPRRGAAAEKTTGRKRSSASGSDPGPATSGS